MVDDQFKMKRANVNLVAVFDHLQSFYTLAIHIRAILAAKIVHRYAVVFD